MTQMRKTLACLLLALTIAAAGLTASAEAVQPGYAMQALIDLAAASVWYCGDLPEGFQAGMNLPESFAFVVMTLGQNTLPELGIHRTMLRDVRTQKAWIETNFECGAVQTMTLDDLAMEGYTGVRVTRTEGNDPRVIVGDLYTAEAPIRPLQEGGAWTEDVAWLGAQARLELTRDAGAACGWRVRSCTLTQAPVMANAADTAAKGGVAEAAAAAFAVNNLVEYVSTTQGFSVEFPAVFTDEMLSERPGEGLEAMLPDGSAQFFARPVHENGVTWDDWLAGLKNGELASEVADNPAAGLVVARWHENGLRVVRGYLFDENGTMVWTVHVAWDEAAYPDMERLAEYTINSLSVDGLGEG